MLRLLLLPLTLLFMAATIAPGLFTTTTRAYRIQPGSVLRLEGKTNVNGFQCACEDRFAEQTFTARKVEKSHLAEFTATRLNVRVRSFDCGNKLMNRDLYKALNAERFPNVQIDLLRVVENQCSLLDDCEGEWVNMKVQMRITLNGHAEEYWMDAKGRKTAAKNYRFTGCKSLCMSEFGITPPTAMLGAVKVQDEIRIIFDLAVTVE